MSILDNIDVDEIILIIFIVISFCNLYATWLDNKHEFNCCFTAKEIFNITTIFSLIIYIYILYRNYSKYRDVFDKGGDFKLYLTRVYGSIFIVVGTLFLTYFQLKSPISYNPSVM